MARFFERDERTVKRWEATRGLPIHRFPGEARSKIFADVLELEAWLNSASSVADPDLPPRLQVEPAFTPLPVGMEGAASPAFASAAAFDRPKARGLSIPSMVAISAATVVLVVAAVLSVAGARSYIRAGMPGSLNRKAIDLFREGRHDWETRTPTGLAHAEDEFMQAIVADPGFARAYVGLADAYLLEREYADLPDREAYPRAAAATQRAIALAPDLAEAHAALGFIDFYWNWDARAAEAQFRRAIMLDPNAPISRQWYAGMLKVQRRYGEALQQIDRAQALTPESSAVLITKADILLEGGDPEAGRRLVLRIEQAEPGQMWPHLKLADVYFEQGRLDDYVSELAAAASGHNTVARTEVMEAARRGLASGGAEAMLKAELQAELKLLDRGFGSPMDVARTYAMMKDYDAAIAWIHRAFAAHDSGVLGLLSDPLLADLRRHRDLGFAARVILGR